MIRGFQGKHPQLGPGCYVDAQAHVSGDVVLGADCSVWPMAVVRGDVNRIRIGARSNIQDCSVLHVTHDGPYTPGGTDLQIGDDVTVGHGVILHACRVGNRCLIGMHATVLDNAVLEDECFVAAGAVVTPGKVLAGGYLYRGSPAQPSRALTPDERAMLRYSAEHYVRLKDQWLAEAATAAAPVRAARPRRKAAAR